MTFREFRQHLEALYDPREAQAVSRLVYEVRYGLSYADVLVGRDAEVPQDDVQQVLQRLLHHEPVQYVLGVADFCGRSFCVAPGVLIPRPETEELCRWVVEELNGQRSTVNGQRSILDIGTGSGCIAVTLAAELPAAHVSACDISDEALAIARENARRHGVAVDFHHLDILTATESSNPHFPFSTPHSPFSTPHSSFAIVSNPPYICNKERARMEPHVLDYEPHTALFVPDDDPLLFYRAIARYAQVALCEDGRLYFEINPCYADALCRLLSSLGYSDIVVRHDTYGKPRMVRARHLVSDHELHE